MTQMMSPDEYFKFASQPNDEDPATEFAVGLMLQPVDHYDAGELPDELAAELGVLMNHLTAAIEAQEFVGRAHVNRWGDGGAHLHFWFMGRPIGQLQMRGSLGILWADLGQALPQRVLDSNHRLVLMNFVARAGGEMAA